MAPKEKGEAIEKTCIKATGMSSFGEDSSVAAVDVKNGKIIRIRPLHFDWKYKPEEWKPWNLEAHGKVFEQPMKTMMPPHGMAYKKRIFSPRSNPLENFARIAAFDHVATSILPFSSFKIIQLFFT